MILSNTSIQEALDHRWLVIDPEPTPRRPVQDGPGCPYQTSAVDLRLSAEIVRPRDDLPVSIDLRRGGYAALAQASHDPFNLTQEQPFNLEPRQLVLGRTIERVCLPIPEDDTTPCYAARIEGRSSFARCGLLVHFTAPTIHAGFDGVLVLEMCNFGPYTIQLYENMRVCQLIIERVSGVPFRNDSQFQGQDAPAGPPARER